MATGSVSSTGLGSNLDVGGIVSSLMAVERRPLTQLQTREAKLQAQISFLGQIKSALSSFQSAAQSLDSIASKTIFRATPSDTTVLGASASDTVAAGTYAIAVSQIAQTQRIAGAGQASKTAAIGTGVATTLTISFGTISGGSLDSGTGIYTGANFTANPNKTAVRINLDSTNNTLEGIRNAINAADAGVSANIVNDGSGTPYRLVLTAADTGAANSLKLGVSGDAALQNLLAYDAAGTQAFSQLQAARDATLTIDGISVTSSSNTVSGAIDGLTLTLIKAGSSTVSVSRDTTQIATAVAQLVNAYNAASNAISDATAKGALLQGETSMVSILNRLRSEVGAIRSGAGTYSSLSQLGISFQKDGTLAFDSAKLGSILNSNYSSAAATLDGFAVALSSLTAGLLGSGGSLQAHTDGINRSIKDIDNRREVLSARLDRIQQRYLSQFTALDTMIAGLKQTSSFLQQQLANLPTTNSK